MKKSVEEIIRRVRVIARNPDSANGAYNDEQLLIIINETLNSEVITFYNHVNRTFFRKAKNIPSPVDNSRLVIDIPERSLYEKILELKEFYDFIQAYNGKTYYDIPRKPVGTDDYAYGYQIEGNKIIVDNWWNSSSYNRGFRVWYTRRPSALTLNYSTIIDIDRDVNLITLDRELDEDVIDIYANDSKQDSLKIVERNGVNLTYEGELDEDVVSGDFVAKEKYAHLLQMPDSADDYLVCVSCLSMGLDDKNIQSLMIRKNTLKRMIKGGGAKRNRNESRQFVIKGIGTKSDESILGSNGYTGGYL